jgi:WD40 repeat protein
MRTHELLEPHAITGVALSPDGQTMAVCIYGYGLKLYDSLTAEYRNHVRGQFSFPTFSPNGVWAVGVGDQVSFVPVDSQSHPSNWSRGACRHAAAFHDGNAITLLSYYQTAELTLPPHAENFATYFDASAKVRNWPRTSQPGWAMGLQPKVLGMTASRLALIWDITPNRIMRYFVLVDLDDFRRIARLDGLPSHAEYGQYFSCGEWFALSTRSEITVFHQADVRKPNDEPSPVEAKPRGIFRSLFDSIVGTPSRPSEVNEFTALPSLAPRLRVPVVGVPPSENLPFAFLPSGDAFLCRGKQSIIEMRETRSGYVLNSWRFGKAWPRAMAVSPDGLTAIAATRGGSVVIWDLQ